MSDGIPSSHLSNKGALRTLLALGTLLSCVTGATGATITDPSALDSGATLIDFEQFAGGQGFGPSLTIGDVTFASVTAELSILDITASGWAADGTEVAGKTLFPGGEPDSAISILFAHPIAQFLLGWGDPSFAGNTLRAYDGDGKLLEEAAIPFDPSGNSAVWVGFARPMNDIARIVVHPVQPLPSGDDYVIDNIRYSTKSRDDEDDDHHHRVPEPAPLSLLVIGVTACAALRRQTLSSTLTF